MPSEALTGKSVDAGGLKEGIKTVNAKRRALHRLSILRKADPAPISGLDALLANQVSFYDNPARFTESLNKDLRRTKDADQQQRRGGPG